jgi:ubiquinone biosynthesis protein COQ4
MKQSWKALVARVRALYYAGIAVVAALRLVVDPDRLDDVFLIDRSLMTPKTMARIVASLRRDPQAARALAERRRAAPIVLSDLAALPPGTLGRHFADFMGARGLDPSAIPRKEHHDEATFVQAHLYETHDIWHVATGFDTDVAGELGVQAFYSAQLDGALPRILLIGGLINARVLHENDWGRRLDAVARGWTLGKRARALFGVRWDELWAVPLAEVRAALGLEPVGPEPVANRAPLAPTLPPLAECDAASY